MNERIVRDEPRVFCICNLFVRDEQSIYIYCDRKIKTMLSHRKGKRRKSISFIYTYILFLKYADALIHYYVIPSLVGHRSRSNQVFIVSLKTYVRYVTRNY